MATTRISDIIVPEVYYPYLVKETKAKSAIFDSGILNMDANMGSFLSGGGLTTNVPFWKDLASTEGNVGSDDPAVDLVPQKISTGKDIAVRQIVIEGWSNAVLSGVMAGDDPMRAIVGFTAKWWARLFERRLVDTLHGVYLDNAANDGGDMVRDIGTDAVGAATAAELISAEAILDAAQTMGDASDDLSAIIMHSQIYTRLAKQNLIDFHPDSNGLVRFPTYLGYRVIKSDNAKTITGTNRTKYVTYLVGSNAIAFNEAPMTDSPSAEVDRKPLAGNGMGVETLITRRQFTMHPYGIKWANTSGNMPTQTMLRTAANWDRVYPERKQIPIAFLLTNG